MNPAGTFIQIILLIVAVVIGFTYLQPTFVEIQSLQDEMQVYKEERTKVDEANRLLQSLLQQVENVDTEDLRALVNYIPDTVDELEVMRTVVAIGEVSDMSVDSIRAGDGQTRYTYQNQNLGLQSQSFTLAVTGEYENLKPFLANLEQNDSPLYITNFAISPSGEFENENEVSVTVELIAFALPASNDEPN